MLLVHILADSILMSFIDLTGYTVLVLLVLVLVDILIPPLTSLAISDLVARTISAVCFIISECLNLRCPICSYSALRHRLCMPLHKHQLHTSIAVLLSLDASQTKEWQDDKEARPDGEGHST